MSRTACPICQSTDLHDEPMTRGPHHAKRVCPQGHYVEWVARPITESSDIPAELRPYCVARKYRAELRGTPGQVDAAESIRAQMFARANREHVPDDVFNMMVGVADATWFLGNKGLMWPRWKCWPKVSQMEAVETLPGMGLN